MRSILYAEPNASRPTDHSYPASNGPPAYSSSSSSSLPTQVIAIPTRADQFHLSSNSQPKSKLTVQISLASLRDATATLLLVLFEHANLLQGLHDLAVDTTGGVDVPRGPVAAVLGRAVDLAEAADTDRLAEVDVARDRCGACVEPVDVLRGEFLGRSGLDGINPALKHVVSIGREEQRQRVLQQRQEEVGETYLEWATCPDASGTQHKPR